MTYNMTSMSKFKDILKIHSNRIFFLYSVQARWFWLSWKKFLSFLPNPTASSQKPMTIYNIGQIRVCAQLNVITAMCCHIEASARQRGEPRHHNLSGLTWGHYHGAPYTRLYLQSDGWMQGYSTVESLTPVSRSPTVVLCSLLLLFYMLDNNITRTLHFVGTTNSTSSSLASWRQ